MLHTSLKVRGAPSIFPPPTDARFVGAQEGLRLYVNQGTAWTYYVIGPGDVLLAFNGFSRERAAERHGVDALVRLAQRVAV